MSFSSFKIADSAVCGGRLFLATGRLYATSDMKEFKKIDAGDGDCTVYDVLVSDGEVFALCASKTEDGYRIFVEKNSPDAPESFSEILAFEYPLPALSFAASEKYFYFGMGQRGHEADDEYCGAVLKIERS